MRGYSDTQSPVVLSLYCTLNIPGNSRGSIEMNNMTLIHLGGHINDNWWCCRGPWEWGLPQQYLVSVSTTCHESGHLRRESLCGEALNIVTPTHYLPSSQVLTTRPKAISSIPTRVTRANLLYVGYFFPAPIYPDFMSFGIKNFGLNCNPE